MKTSFFQFTILSLWTKINLASESKKEGMYGLEVLVVANCTLYLGSAQIMITLSWGHDKREKFVPVEGRRNWWLSSHLSLPCVG